MHSSNRTRLGKPMNDAGPRLPTLSITWHNKLKHGMRTTQANANIMVLKRRCRSLSRQKHAMRSSNSTRRHKSMNGSRSTSPERIMTRTNNLEYAI